jgi:hypothetical protein
MAISEIAPGREIIYAIPEGDAVNDRFEDLRPVNEAFKEASKLIPGFCVVLNGSDAQLLNTKGVNSRDIDNSVNDRVRPNDSDFYIPNLKPDQYNLLSQMLEQLPGWEWITDGIEENPEPNTTGEWSGALGTAIYNGREIDIISSGGFKQGEERIIYIEIKLINGSPTIIDRDGNLEKANLVIAGGSEWYTVSNRIIFDKLLLSSTALQERRFRGLFNSPEGHLEELLYADKIYNRLRVLMFTYYMDNLNLNCDLLDRFAEKLGYSYDEVKARLADFSYWKTQA